MKHICCMNILFNQDACRRYWISSRMPHRSKIAAFRMSMASRMHPIRLNRLTTLHLTWPDRRLKSITHKEMRCIKTNMANAGQVRSCFTMLSSPQSCTHRSSNIRGHWLISCRFLGAGYGGLSLTHAVKSIVKSMICHY